MTSLLYDTPTAVQDIAATPDPIVRNLRITQSYYDISKAFRGCASGNANWCTFAAWASQQAGRTIRGEDLVDNLQRRALMPTPLLAIADKCGRWFVRRGLFNPNDRLGRLATTIHGPLDGLEAASSDIALGNKKVFEEIGFEFARFLAERGLDTVADAAGLAAFCNELRPGPPPDGQGHLRDAFTNYYMAKFTTDPASRAQLEYLANVQIGFHEQIRLQPQIQSGMTDPVVDEADWGFKLLASLAPSSTRWWTPVRRLLATMLRVTLRPVRVRMLALVRDTVTEQMMTLTIAGRQWSLAAPIPLPPSPLLDPFTNADLIALMASVPMALGAPGNVGASDWSDLGQRMRYIGYLFRVYHQRPEVFDSPFSAEQVEAIRQGLVPSGQL